MNVLYSDSQDLNLARDARRILVVDDVTEVREVMSLALRHDGYVVRELPSALQIEIAIEEFRPDLILCDVLMPGRDGMAVFDDLQANPLTRDIPVVFVTAKHFAGDRRAALQAGVAGYIEKPFAVSALLDTVQEALSGTSGVRVWGCRGAVAAPEWSGGRFGGNTSCVELVVSARGAQGQKRVIFDAGTGIRALGNSLGGTSPLRATLCLTHFHWDHIQGLPFFKPLYQAGNEFSLFGPAHSDTALVETIQGQMGGAFFPITPDAFSSSVKYTGLQEQEFLSDGLTLRSFSTMHPGSTLAYQVECESKRVVYAPDNEIAPEMVQIGPDGAPILLGEAARLAQWLQGADLLLHDCQYSDAAYESHRGWGHSPARSVAALAAVAGVKRLLLFHHDPDHDDRKVEAIHQQVRAHLESFGGDYAARIQSESAGEDRFYAL